MACVSSHTRSADPTSTRARPFLRAATLGLRALTTVAFGALAACPATAPRTVQVAVEDRDLCARAPDDARCRPVSTHAQVELRNHLAGCAPGPRGSATYRIGGELLAELRPGEHRSVRLPRGDVEVRVSEAPAESLVQLSLGGSGPVVVEAGCPASRFVGTGLAPLVLVGPESACPPVRVRASGLDFELGAGITWTLLVPHGDHVIRFGGAPQTVAVGAEGARLNAPSCGPQGQRRGGSLTASRASSR